MLEYDRIDISKGVVLIKQIYQKNLSFVTIGFLKIFVLNMSLIFAMVVMI